jgi:hypothetical protein
MSTAEFQSIVSEFFDEQGWSCQATLIKTTSVYDPLTSENTQTEKRYVVKAMPFDYINKFQGVTTQDSTLIKTGDKQVFVKPIPQITDIDPSADKIQIGNTIYKIVTVKVVNPTLNLPLYYELFVRV